MAKHKTEQYVAKVTFDVTFTGNLPHNKVLSIIRYIKSECLPAIISSKIKEDNAITTSWKVDSVSLEKRTRY